MARIDQYAEVTSVPAGFELVGNDVTDTSGGTQPNGTVKRITAPNFLKGTVGVVNPSGDTSGAADVAAINEIIANGGVCQLAQAPNSGNPYIVNSPLLPSDGSGLKGMQPWSSSANDTYGPAGGGQSGGTTILALNFSGAAIINMTNATGNQYTGVTLEDFCIEGYATGGTGCHGILIDGAWGAGFIRGVTVHRPDQDCIRFAQDPTSNDLPDEWVVVDTKASAARNGYGIYCDNLADARFVNVNSSENNLDGWYVNWSTNMGLTGCKSENNGGAGFHLTGQGYPNAALNLTGCTTHLNGQDGFLFDNPNSNPNGCYLLSNCYAIDDNQSPGSGTTYSSYRSNGSPARIMASNCFGLGAMYGAYEGGGSYGMCFTGSYLTGTTAATHDDGSNTHALVNQSPVPF